MQTGAEGSASALDERPNGGKHSEKQVRLALRRSLGLPAAPTGGQTCALSSFPGRGASLSAWARPWPTRAPSLVHCSRSEEHTSELQSLMRISYAVFCLKKINKNEQRPT